MYKLVDKTYKNNGNRIESANKKMHEKKVLWKQTTKKIKGEITQIVIWKNSNWIPTM